MYIYVIILYVLYIWMEVATDACIGYNKSMYIYVYVCVVWIDGERERDCLID